MASPPWSTPAMLQGRLAPPEPGRPPDPGIEQVDLAVGPERDDASVLSHRFPPVTTRPRFPVWAECRWFCSSVAVTTLLLVSGLAHWPRSGGGAIQANRACPT